MQQINVKQQSIGSIHLVTCQTVRIRLNKYAFFFVCNIKRANIQLVIKRIRFLVGYIKNGTRPKFKFYTISASVHVQLR